MQNSNVRKDVKSEKRKSFKARLFSFVFNIGLIFVAICGLYVLFVFLQMPSLDAILHETREPAIIFLDKDGEEIRSSGRIMGTPVSVQNLPSHVYQAILAIEDKNFYKHGALSYRGTFRALIVNLFRGKFAAGGSTITQQTAKNVFLSRDKKVSRKVQELILSYWLENRFNKNQILDLYMNRISLVGGLRGIDAASMLLFGHGANKMSVAESAQIAAMLKAPTTYSPLKNPDRNIQRARVVLVEMVKQGYITLETAQRAAKELKAVNIKQDKNIYRYWTDFVMDEIESRIGNINKDLYVYTTMNKKLQSRIASALSANVGEYQGAIVSVARDGAIQAMVGGDDYQASQFNLLTSIIQRIWIQTVPSACVTKLFWNITIRRKSRRRKQTQQKSDKKSFPHSCYFKFFDKNKQAKNFHFCFVFFVILLWW